MTATEARAVLVDATFEAIADVGYRNLATKDVARRAGLSQGGLFRHFATKDELVGAVIDTFDPGTLVGETDRWGLSDVLFAKREMPLNERFDSFVALLFDVTNSTGGITVMELQLAARTDTALAHRLQLLDRVMRDAFHEMVAFLFPELVAERWYHDVTSAVSDLVRGAVLGGLPLPAQDRPQRRAEVQRHARAILLSAQHFAEHVP